MWVSPSTAKVVNQISMIGPKTRPMPPVPRLLDEEQPGQDGDGDRDHPVGQAPRSRTRRPSTAASTEMAGVIMPSP